MALSATTQLCHCSVKVVIHCTSINELFYVSMKLYLQRQVQAQIWPLGHSLLSPGLEGKSLKYAIVMSMLIVLKGEE